MRLHANTLVDEVDPERGRVVAGGTVHEADVVVVAAGAWADRLEPGLRGVAVPSRQAVMYLSPPPNLAQAWVEAPVMLDLRESGGLYTLPPRRGTRLKVGDHVFSRSGDPDEDRFATDRDPRPPAAGGARGPTATLTVMPFWSARLASTR